MQHEDQDREEHQDDPGTLEELGDGEDDHHRERHHRRAPVDRHPVLPARLSAPEVMLDHAAARHGEAREDADGVDGH